MSNNNSTIEAYRHTLAHIAMQAMRRLYDAIPGVGPAIENGFYHDFAANKTVTEDDLPAIEEEMKKIIAEDLPVAKKVLPIDEGIALLKERGYTYTVELAEDLKHAGETEISFFEQGEFINMCKGPHVERTGVINPDAFKLTKLAGAYWKGDEQNDMIQRLYGVAFTDKKALRQHLAMLEEAAKRDHKILGPQMDLFTFSPLVGSGLPLWTPKGTLLRDLLDEYVWELRSARGYERVEIPHITKKDLYETSGHWDKFKDELFRIVTREGHEFAMKPMNCPHHTQIYARKPHSYRELPQRYANTTMVYRDEQSGELAGLARVRSITQDDAHVFCRGSQVKEEINAIWDIIEEFYGSMGFVLQPRLSLHDPANADAYLGSNEDWDRAEEQLRELARERGENAPEEVGEAAFYGPKIDFMGKDSLGREWQVATIQLDMNMPERFDLTCINEEGEKERIVMIHAAIMGSLERFLATAIEHFAGVFPVWLAPVQVTLVAVGSDHVPFCRDLAAELQSANIRVDVDESNETVGNKIRKAAGEKVPYMLVVGDKEMQSDHLSVRMRGSKDTKQMAKDDFIAEVTEKVLRRE